jgi:hypothetical protein
MLRLGKVVAVHPEDESVDLVMTDDLSRVVGAQVICDFAGTDFGETGLAAPDPTGSQWDPSMSGTRDIIAVVGTVRKRFIVLGFLYPQVCQMTFAEPGMRIKRYPSDVYSMIDGLGNVEFYHPSGLYIRLSSTTAHQDLTGQDVDGNWAITKNTGTPVHMHIEQAGGKAVIDVDPSGNVSMTTQGTYSINGQGDVSVQTQGNASVQAQGTATVKGASIILDGPASCTKSLAVQETITAQGAISSATDVTAGPQNISLVGHPHTSATPGSPTSPPLPG